MLSGVIRHCPRSRNIFPSVIFIKNMCVNIFVHVFGVIAINIT